MYRRIHNLLKRQRIKDILQVEACVTADDVRVETMRASGPGGQNVNQRATAVRLTHRETGISVHCMDERTQYSNMEVYFRLFLVLS